MLNGHTLNGAPLNGAPRRTVLGPVVVQPVVSVLWNVRVMLAGTDISDQLTGSVRIEREEGAATLADIVIALDAGPVNPSAYIGNTVEIYYQHWNGSGWDEHLRFRGQVVRPQYDLQGRLLSCECSDRLQDAVEALTVAQVDTLCAGAWSADIYESPEGRSRWDYAQERMATRAASLQRSVEGELQVAAWAAAAAPHWLLPVGTALDETLDYVPVELSERINVVELELDYRFQRLRQRHQTWDWMHPDISDDSLTNGFCVWRIEGGELPTISMCLEATASVGYPGQISATWAVLPPSGSYCIPPAAWINTYTDLVLHGTWTNGRRWVQLCTEQYRLRVEAPASIAQAGEVIRRDSIAAETESDRADAFANVEAFTAPEDDATEDAMGDWVVDLREPDRLDDAVLCGLQMAKVQILAAHRGNRLAFSLPTSDTLGMRLEHTLKIEEEVAARTIRGQGKLFSLVDEWSFDDGSAITAVVLAISQGGGTIDDELLPPAAPSTTPAGSPPALIHLPSQLGGRADSPPYDDTIPGFSGNYDGPLLGSETYPRRMTGISPEIPAEHVDEFAATAAATYRVAIPEDLLEL